MCIASIYIAVLITNWNSANVITNSLSPSGFSFWVRVIIAWVTTFIYLWTIIAPKILPSRDFNVVWKGKNLEKEERKFSMISDNKRIFIQKSLLMIAHLIFTIYFSVYKLHKTTWTLQNLPKTNNFLLYVRKVTLTSKQSSLIILIKKWKAYNK